MPKVPQYQESVRPEGVNAPTFRPTTSGAAGSGLARGLGQAADAVASMVQDERQKAARAKLNEVKALTWDQQKQLLHGEDGLYHAQGEDALPAASRVQDQWTQFRSDVTTDVPPWMLPEIEEYLVRADREFEGRVLQHQTTEIDKHIKRSFEARVQAGTEELVDLAGDDERYAEKVAETLTDITRTLDELGYDPDEIKDYRDKWYSDALLRSTNSLLDRDQVDDARAFYEANKEDMSQTARDAVLKALRPQEDRAKAVAAADAAAALVGEVGQEPSAEGIAAARTKINAIQDPQVRQLAAAELERQLQGRRDVWQEYVSDVYEAAYRRVEANREYIPTALEQQWLRPDQRTNLYALAERMRTPADEDTDWEYVWNVYDSLPVAEKVKYDILELAGHMSPQHFKEWYGRHTRLVQDWEAAQAAASQGPGPVATFEQHWGTVTARMPEEITKEQLGKMKAAAYIEVEAMREEKGRKLTAREYEEVFAPYVKQAIDESYWTIPNPFYPVGPVGWRLGGEEILGGPVRAIESPSPSARVRYEDIPPERIQFYENLLSSSPPDVRGMPQTESEKKKLFGTLYFQELRSGTEAAGIPGVPTTAPAAITPDERGRASRVLDETIAAGLYHGAKTEEAIVMVARELRERDRRLKIELPARARRAQKRYERMLRSGMSAEDALIRSGVAALPTTAEMRAAAEKTRSLLLQPETSNAPE